MRRILCPKNALLISSACLVLAACGGATDSETTSSSTTGRSDADVAERTIAPRVDCRAVARSADDAKSEGAAYDIRGLKPGLSYDDAFAAVSCAEGIARVEDGGAFFRMNTHGFPTRQKLIASNGVACTSDDAVRGRYGQPDYEKGGCDNRLRGFSQYFKNVDDVMMLAFTGVEGEETLRGVWRARYFDAGSRPSYDAMRASLVEKYGEPHFTTHTDAWLSWVFDARGRPMSQSDPNFITCANGSPMLDGAIGWNAACGVTLAAYLHRSRSDPALIEKLDMGLIDQAGLYEGAEAMQAALDAMHAERQAAEASEASKSLSADDL
ncbi:hypothetical protein [Parvularcula lutaonensis]|uniref:Uncharacterized protein n=1 Tax=Parvularcula lutaonensis TaxID=491923 RepID=A0ABV7MC81_9PROT|nr:hypothetical protein [Parvularcula lutaonensis]GGY37074.1 hypothetical protein GCM10007148_01580 [Parvularcula lutaonensis]